VPNFLLRSPGKLHNWSKHCMWAHRLFSDDRHGGVIQIFSKFSVILLLLHNPQGSSYSTYAWPPLKHECHSKTTVQLKECSPKASRSISKVSVVDLELHAKPDANTLLDFSTHCRSNKTLNWKSTHVKTMCVHSSVSYDRLMQSTCRGVTLASPLIFHQGSYNSDNPGTFWYNLVNTGYKLQRQLFHYMYNAL
jgi:hypothetical protein